MYGAVDIDSSTMNRASFRIIEMIAEREGVDPTEITPPTYEPLSSVCDPEALDSVFSNRANGARRNTGCVSFPYCGYDVQVWADATVLVTPSEGQSSSPATVSEESGDGRARS